MTRYSPLHIQNFSLPSLSKPARRIGGRGWGSSLTASLLLAVLAVSMIPAAPAQARSTIVNIAFSPAQAEIGKDLTVSLALSNPALHQQDIFLGAILVCNTSCVTVQQFSATGASGSKTFNVTNSFQVGVNKIQAEMRYQLSADSVDLFEGKADLTVIASTQTTPSISVSDKGKVLDTSKVKFKLEAVYTPGNSGRTATKFDGQCPEGELHDDNPADPQFECWYPPSPPKDYFVKASASDAAGIIVTGPADPGQKVSVTGSEENEQTAGTGSNPSDIAKILGGGLVSLINGILTVIVGILRWIVWLIASFIIIPLLEVTLSIDAANISATIFTGWSIVRDIVNMIFILILIILGFATILKIESYNYRKILVELIIMAILVNFSLVIGRIIIQIADIVQFTFLPQGEGVNGIRYLFKVLMLDQTKTAINGLSLSASGALAGTVSILFQFIIELGVVITFAALAIYTIIRIIALWFLLILSPFAYALRVLPATHHQASEWWSNFIKYAFFTPIMAFFLRITIEIHNKGLALTQGVSFGGPTDKPAPTVQDFLAKAGVLDQVPLKMTIELFINYIVVLGFMWGGLIVASKMSIMGADAVTSVAKKGLAAPFAYGWKGTKLAGGFVGQKIHKTTGIELRPGEWKKGWEEYREKRKKEDKVIGGQKAEKMREHGHEVLGAMGSPLDFYRKFLDPSEYKRMIAGGQKGANTAYKGAKDKLKEADETLSTDEEAKLNAERLTNGRDASIIKNDLRSNEARLNDGTTDNKLGESERAVIVEIINRKKEEEKELRANYKDVDADAIKAEYTALETQLKNPAANTVVFDPTGSVGKAIQEALKSLFASKVKEMTMAKKGFTYRDENNVLQNKRSISNDDKTKILEAVQKYTQQGNAWRAPQSYEHDLERLHLEGEEMSKLKGIENSDQLVSLLHEAVRNKNQFRVAAIWKKLANDYNDNEALNHTVDPNAKTRGKEKGDSYGSGRVGMQHYMEDVFRKELGMDEQSALKLTDEIAYINESRNHWANARLVNYGGGKLNYNTENEHVSAAVMEISKKNPRAAMGDINRLGYGEEVQHRDGTREFNIDKLGLAIGKILGKAWADSKQMNYMNSSALKNLNKSIDGLRGAGVSGEFIKEIVSRAGKGEVDWSKVIERL